MSQHECYAVMLTGRSTTTMRPLQGDSCYVDECVSQIIRVALRWERVLIGCSGKGSSTNEDEGVLFAPLVDRCSGAGCASGSRWGRQEFSHRNRSIAHNAGGRPCHLNEPLVRVASRGFTNVPNWPDLAGMRHERIACGAAAVGNDTIFESEYRATS